MATLPQSGSASSVIEFSPRSSFMELCKYDAKANTLDITFKSGSVHRYLFCFPTTFESFRQSPDHSSFYARAIKGRLVGVQLQNKNIGRQKKEPLKAIKRAGRLDAGIKHQPGTVARAGL